MKALILGLGISGNSAATLLKRRGFTVEVCDDRLCPKQYATLEGFDLFVPSPGIPQTHPTYQLAIQEGIPTSGEVDLFLQTCPNRCIGVTGTNGKTTTVSMIAHVLRGAGLEAVAAGNLGAPLCEVSSTAICVLELSSFQLETIYTPKLEIGVILNISPDHLDRYSTFEEYVAAKVRMQDCICKGGSLLIHNSVDAVGITQPFHTFSGGVEEITELVCRKLGVEDLSPISTFKRPDHRLEHVATIEGITYINDSKATNVGATLYALDQISGPCVIIVGGQAKGHSFEGLRQGIRKEIQVVVYGEAREKIANALQPNALVHVVETLKSAVEKAESLASRGATVLFSPACASFDAFRNYEERGEAFKQYVRRSTT